MERASRRARRARGFVAVHPISKLNLEQLDPACPRASGNAESLDQLIARKLKLAPFDAAVVAWDIVPALKPRPRLEPEGCRWLETRWIMGRLATSTALPHAWCEVAERLAHDYTTRPTPGARAVPRPLLQNEVRLLCMEPEFEDLLLDEGEIRDVLGVAKTRVSGWPTSWTASPARRGKAILDEAIEAARKKRAPGFPCIPGTMARTAPNEWAEWLVRSLAAAAGPRSRMAAHTIIQRLSDLLPVPDDGPNRRLRGHRGRSVTRHGA